VTHVATQFQPGDRITFTAYYRDQLDSQPSLYRIIAPDGTIYSQWSHSNPQPFYTLSYWWWAYDFPVGVMTGTWRFEVQFNGRTYDHAFFVGQPSTATATPTMTPSATPSPTGTVDPPATPTTTPSPQPTATRALVMDRLNFIPAVLGSEGE
jgi:hypothetical protein